jgi:hypothetical protein
MKDIIQRVLLEQTNLSNAKADCVAREIVNALGPYARNDDIGSRTEYAESAS